MPALKRWTLVLPYAALMAGDEASVRRSCKGSARRLPGLLLKVILETGVLGTDALIAQASQLALDAGADFLKTSTGKVAVGATPQAARVMLRAIARHPQLGGRAGFRPRGVQPGRRGHLPRAGAGDPGS